MMQHHKPVVGYRRSARKNGFDEVDPRCRDPEIWGRRVTICIAGCTPAGDDPAIAVVSDMMISFADDMPAADNVMMKDWRLDDFWGCLFAGNPALFEPLTQSIGEELGGFGNIPDLDAHKMGMAVARGYQKVRTERIVLTYLNAYGFRSIEEFNNNALSSFCPEIMEGFTKKTERFELDAELLVYGFEGRTLPRLIEIANPGIPYIRDPMPHWAIGSGTFMAMGVLSARGTEPYGSVEELVYRLCEAKFVSESAKGVGRPTSVFVWYGGTIRPDWLLDHDIEILRRIWLKTRNSPAPKGARTAIKTALARYRRH